MPFNAHLFIDKSSEVAFENKDIFKKAALMYDFDLNSDFSNFDDTEIELLKNKAFQKVDGKYALPDDLRNDVIEKIGVNQIAEEINKNEIKTEFSETLLKNIQEPKTNYKELSNNELFYSTKIAQFLPNNLNTQAIQSELQRRQFFIPFEKITKNFAGRRKELDALSEYVDWLPKKGLGNKVVGFFRNIISWYDKPPMLIHGIGGIGKSTLISKFIMEQNSQNNGKMLPFVYIDFDLPGFTLKEPLNILIESLRQLAIQFPNQNRIFEEICEIINQMTFNKYQTPTNISYQTKYQSTTTSTRGFIYNSIEEVIQRYDYNLERINTPILIVFDSFEEIQYRASRDELNTFFTFIREVSEKIPRIRTVFAGRSEVTERLGDFEFEKLPLTEFDEEASSVVLKKFGISDSSIFKRVFKYFGGNPLLLQLAADLIKKDESAIKDFEKIKDKKHEYLINRILGHIHNESVRKIAVPGMLLRGITPEIIKNVLAEPCGLGQIDDDKAKSIFDELHKEVALISRSSDDGSIEFRQDLRIACEKMILEKYAKESEEIRAKAIEYYKNRKGENPEFEAEFYYHLFKKSEIPSEFNKKAYDRTNIYLESAIKEFPEKIQIRLSSFVSSRVAQTVVDNSSIVEFENYYLPQIKRTLNGELSFLKQLYKEINQRTERSEDSNSQFPIYEALLCQRLNKLNESNTVIDNALKIYDSDKNRSSYIDCLFIKIQNWEYQSSYKKSDELLNLIQLNEQDIRLPKYWVLLRRIVDRLGIKDQKMPLIWNFIGVDYLTKEDFIDTNWRYLSQNNYFTNFTFKSAKDFDQIHDEMIDKIDGFKELEVYCQKILGVFLKDISLTGEFEIVFKDFLYILEAEGKLDLLMNENTTNLI
jgi:hypothetical protein